MRTNWKTVVLVVVALTFGFAIGAKEKGPRITRDNVTAAEKLIGVEFTDAERDSMLQDLEYNLESYEKLRAVTIDNAVPPAFLLRPPGEGRERKAHPVVAFERVAVPLEEGPVEPRERAVALRIERAASAVVAHAIDVRGPGDVGLRRAQLARGEACHRQHVGLHHPVVGVDVGDPEPVAELARTHPEQGRQVGQHHQARDVVAVAGAPDVGHDGIQARQPRLGAPEGGRQRRVGVERGRAGAAIEPLLVSQNAPHAQHGRGV